MKMELCCCEKTLLDEISAPKMTKKVVAMTYRLALESTEDVDWAKVNRTIIDRWSMRALQDIKNWAWSGKCFQSTRKDRNTC